MTKPSKIEALIAEAREMDAGVQVTKYDSDARTFIKGPSIVAQLAAALESVYADSLTAQAEHARWQERAEKAEAELRGLR